MTCENQIITCLSFIIIFNNFSEVSKNNNAQEISMKFMIHEFKKTYLLVIVLMATAGTVFFFPVNIGGKYTCFYHRIFHHSQPIPDGMILDHHQKQIKNVKESNIHNPTNAVNSPVDNESSPHGSGLMDNYLHQYAFPWWTSVGLLSLCIYLLLKVKKSKCRRTIRVTD